MCIWTAIATTTTTTTNTSRTVWIYQIIRSYNSHVTKKGENSNRISAVATNRSEKRAFQINKRSSIIAIKFLYANVYHICEYFHNDAQNQMNSVVFMFHHSSSARNGIYRIRPTALVSSYWFRISESRLLLLVWIPFNIRGTFLNDYSFHNIFTALSYHWCSTSTGFVGLHSPQNLQTKFIISHNYHRFCYRRSFFGRWHSGNYQ